MIADGIWVYTVGRSSSKRKMKRKRFVVECYKQPRFVGKEAASLETGAGILEKPNKKVMDKTIDAHELFQLTQRKSGWIAVQVCRRHATPMPSARPSRMTGTTSAIAASMLRRICTLAPDASRGKQSPGMLSRDYCRGGWIGIPIAPP